MLSTRVNSIPSCTMRVVTWNVAGRVGSHTAQARMLASQDADVVALQEVTPRTAPLGHESLAAAGFASVVDAVDELPPKPSKRRLAVLTAARSELERLPAPEVPWPERVLCCAVDGIELVNVHSPISPAPDLAQVRTREAVAAYLSGRSGVLCGDLNTPRRELADGTLLTFAHDTNGRLRPERGERWDRAERALVRDLGWTDAFRAINGYGTRDA